MMAGVSKALYLVHPLVYIMVFCGYRVRQQKAAVIRQHPPELSQHLLCVHHVMEGVAACKKLHRLSAHR